MAFRIGSLISRSLVATSGSVVRFPIGPKSQRPFHSKPRCGDRYRYRYESSITRRQLLITFGYVGFSSASLLWGIYILKPKEKVAA
ncbi:MAG: hypothetical protein Harvfovirus14_29 [Harvfovirus sp.]|uniref:Uncharacterized protein n=1 Tax=Harvfovirus sp. TaxID=2487768 RepID=A0A3G5A1F7_9VIRU|nr:MAG: hypothetical protein Harvfovirus14_29 [Harvfovirus sp.]